MTMMMTIHDGNASPIPQSSNPPFFSSTSQSPILNPIFQAWPGLAIPNPQSPLHSMAAFDTRIEQSLKFIIKIHRGLPQSMGLRIANRAALVKCAADHHDDAASAKEKRLPVLHESYSEAAARGCCPFVQIRNFFSET